MMRRSPTDRITTSSSPRVRDGEGRVNAGGARAYLHSIVTGARVSVRGRERGDASGVSTTITRDRERGRGTTGGWVSRALPYIIEV